MQGSESYRLFFLSFILLIVLSLLGVVAVMVWLATRAQSDIFEDVGISGSLDNQPELYFSEEVGNLNKGDTFTVVLRANNFDIDKSSAVNTAAITLKFDPYVLEAQKITPFTKISASNADIDNVSGTAYVELLTERTPSFLPREDLVAYLFSVKNADTVSTNIYIDEDSIYGDPNTLNMVSLTPLTVRF